MAQAHAQSHFGAVKTDRDTLVIDFRLYVIDFDYALENSLAWRKRNVHLEMRNLKQTELHRLKNRGKKG